MFDNNRVHSTFLESRLGGESMEKRFRALRTIATIYKILAWLVLIFGVGVALAFFAHTLFGDAMATGLSGGAFELFSIIGVLLYACALFLVLYGAGEAIYLGLAIEENTRETSRLLRYLQR